MPCLQRIYAGSLQRVHFIIKCFPGSLGSPGKQSSAPRATKSSFPIFIINTNRMGNKKQKVVVISGGLEAFARNGQKTVMTRMAGLTTINENWSTIHGMCSNEKFKHDVEKIFSSGQTRELHLRWGHAFLLTEFSEVFCSRPAAIFFTKEAPIAEKITSILI